MVRDARRHEDLRAGGAAGRRRPPRRAHLVARARAWALEELGAPDQAATALESALARRPDDGDLALYAADVAARRGDQARAEALLEAARPRVRLADWRRAAAAVAAGRGDLQAALALWREVAEADPLDTGAHERVAQHLAELEGPAAACEHLRAAAARFPHHVGLQHTWLEWLRGVDPLGAEAPLMDLLARQPGDAWAQREAALLRREQRRFDEALEHAALACELDPGHPTSWGARGEVARQAGRPGDATAWLRAALERHVDLPYAVSGLLACHEDPAARRDALAWPRGEALRQPSSGLALSVWCREAADLLGQDGVLQALRAARDERPDRRDVWSALVDALAQAGGLDEARAVADEATARFPLRAPLWLDAARVRRLLGDEAGRRAALERAAEVDRPRARRLGAPPGRDAAARGRAGARAGAPRAQRRPRPPGGEQPRLPGRRPPGAGRAGAGAGAPGARPAPGPELRLGLGAVVRLVGGARPAGPRGGPGPRPGRAAPARAAHLGAPGPAPPGARRARRAVGGARPRPGHRPPPRRGARPARGAARRGRPLRRGAGRLPAGRVARRGAARRAARPPGLGVGRAGRGDAHANRPSPSSPLRESMARPTEEEARPWRAS